MDSYTRKLEKENQELKEQINALKAAAESSADSLPTHRNQPQTALVDTEFERLRVKAESILSERSTEEHAMAKQIQEATTLLHELEVQQVELEIQNEELRSAQKLIELVRDKYTDLFEYSPLGYMIVTKNGTVEEVNQSGAKMMQWDKNHIIEKPLTAFILPEDHELFYRHLRKVIQSRELTSVQVRMKRKDGTFFYASLESILVKTGEENFGHYRTSISDVTEQVEIKQKLEEYASELADLNLNKDKFFSIVAHDLKNPLGAFLGFSEYLVHLPEDFDMEHVKRIGPKMYATAKNLFTLLENLLLWSRLQLGALQVKPDRVNLSDMLQSSLNLHQPSADEKKITISTSIPEDVFVFADTNMMSTVARNLLSNAIKFTKEGGEIKLSAKRVDDRVIVTVEDDGVGISKEMQENLFKLDKQTSTDGTSNEKGSGLGLIICKEFVDKNNGTIWLESELGEGSKFHFLLPEADSKVNDR